MQSNAMKKFSARIALVALAAASTVLVPIGTANATEMPTLVPSSNNLSTVAAPSSLKSVKCVGPNWCVAVGQSALDIGGARVITGNPATWSAKSAKNLVPTDQGLGPVGHETIGQRLDAIDCTSTTWCVAIGGRGYVCGDRCGGTTNPIFAYGNPATWKSSNILALPTSWNFWLNSVSCVSQTYCVAIGGMYTKYQDGTGVLVGNPAGWASGDGPLFIPDARASGIECVAVAKCVALTPDANVFFGNPNTWAESGLHDFSAEKFPNLVLTGISCDKITSCTAVGNFDSGPVTVTGDPSKWNGRRDVKSIGTSAYRISSLTCTNSANCVAAVGKGENPGILRGDPKKWKAKDVRTTLGPQLKNGVIAGISCTSSVNCTLIANNENSNKIIYYVGDPAKWQANSLKTFELYGVAFGALIWPQSFSCSSAKLCTEVGTDTYSNLVVIQGDPNNWEKAALRVIATAGSMVDPTIECFNAKSCVATGTSVTQNPVVITGDPMKWTTGSLVSIKVANKVKGFGSSLSALSCVAANWCLAVGVDAASQPVVVTGDPSKWNATSVKEIVLDKSFSGGGGSLGAVSCVSKTFCVAVGTGGNPESEFVNPIVAVGDPTKWKKSSFRQLDVPNFRGSWMSIPSISCVTTTYCAEVSMVGVEYGSASMTVSGDPSKWTADDFHIMQWDGAEYWHDTVLSKIRCTAVAQCTSVGWANASGTLLRGDPTSWRFARSLRSAYVPSLTVGSINLVSCVGTNCWVAGTDNQGAAYVASAPPAIPDGCNIVRNYLVCPGSDLTGADLTDANLSNADLTGTILKDAQLTNVFSGGITGVPSSLPSGWFLKNGYLVGPGANLSQANLSNMNLADVDLTGATLINVSSGGITGTPSGLPADWALVNGYLIGPRAILTGANLDGIDLSEMKMTGVTSGGITGTPSALPAGWALVNGYLVGPGVDLMRVDLTGANLAGVNLDGANLWDATLTNVSSGGIPDSNVSLPDGWYLTVGYLVGPSANSTNANLSGANLDNVDLSGATLTGVMSGGIGGTPLALPAGWTLNNGYLFGPGADLRNANLSGMNLDSVDLSDFDLTGIISGGIEGMPNALPAGWTLNNGYLFGPGANLSGADLTGFDLTGVNLTDVNLDGVNLTDANLTDVISSGITGEPAALPTGWTLENGVLVYS